jgi:hypothetical protein
MANGINAAVAANVPTCAKLISPIAYRMAVRCSTYEEAYYRWLLPIKDRLPIPLVEPWERTEKNQKKVLATTSQYTQGNTDPVDHDRRATEASRSVAEFSEGARKPERSGIGEKISPLKRGPSRIPVECVCPGCGRDVRRAWAIVNGDIIQIIDHDKCLNRDTVHGGLAPQAGAHKHWDSF